MKSFFALCSHRRDGKELWRREAPPGKPHEVHKVSSPRSPRPYGWLSGVYVYFVPFGLVAYDFKGNEQWRKAVPMGFVLNRSGTSPAIAGDTVVLIWPIRMKANRTSLAVDARNREKRAGKRRARACIASLLDSHCLADAARKRMCVCGSLRVAGYEPRTGKERWTALRASPQ